MKREFLTQFMERLIVELEREQRDGTAHVYQSTLKRLKKFANGREVSFKQLTPEWLSQFERKLLADQLKWNSISTYMRTLRSVYNQAVERGIASYIPVSYTHLDVYKRQRTKGLPWLIRIDLFVEQIKVIGDEN